MLKTLCPVIFPNLVLKICEHHKNAFRFYGIFFRVINHTKKQTKILDFEEEENSIQYVLFHYEM